MNALKILNSQKIPNLFHPSCDVGTAPYGMKGVHINFKGLFLSKKEIKLENTMLL